MGEETGAVQGQPHLAKQDLKALVSIDRSKHLWVSKLYRRSVARTSLCLLPLFSVTTYYYDTCM